MREHHKSAAVRATKFNSKRGSACGMYSPANAGFHAFMLATLWHYLTAIVIEFIDADTEL